jgi:hypothetical protein
MRSNPGIAPPSHNTRKSLWTKIPCSLFLLTATNCGEQTAISYRNLTSCFPSHGGSPALKEREESSASRDFRFPLSLYILLYLTDVFRCVVLVCKYYKFEILFTQLLYWYIQIRLIFITDIYCDNMFHLVNRHFPVSSRSVLYLGTLQHNILKYRLL